jgi:hypothetical protein
LAIFVLKPMIACKNNNSIVLRCLKLLKVLD